MPKILDSLYGEIASAIREKQKSSSPIIAAEFPDHILGIETKGTCSSYPLIVQSLKGAVITATQSDVTLTQTIDDSGSATLWLPTAGDWILVASKGSYSSSPTIISVPEWCMLKGTHGVLDSLATQRYNDALAQTLRNESDQAAFFAGAGGICDTSRIIDRYSADGVHTVPGTLAISYRSSASGKCEDNMIIGGGGDYENNDNFYIETTEVVSIDGTVSFGPSLSKGRYNLACATIDDSITIFAGGMGAQNASSKPTNAVDYFTPDMVTDVLRGLSVARYGLRGARAGDIVLFAGGEYNDSGIVSSNAVDSYTIDGSHSTATNLPYGVVAPGPTEIGDNAIFTCGFDRSYGYTNYVSLYNNTGTRTEWPQLQTARANVCASSCKDVVLISGGSTGASGATFNLVDKYTSDGTHSIYESLFECKYCHVSTTIGNMILIAGGESRHNDVTYDMCEYYRII